MQWVVFLLGGLAGWGLLRHRKRSHGSPSRDRSRRFVTETSMTLTVETDAESVTAHRHARTGQPTEEWVTVRDRNGERTWLGGRDDRKRRAVDTVATTRIEPTPELEDGE